MDAAWRFGAGHVADRHLSPHRHAAGRGGRGAGGVAPCGGRVALLPERAQCDAVLPRQRQGRAAEGPALQHAGDESSIRDFAFIAKQVATQA